ncbi:MAG: nucleoside kinase [Bacilli bacterium]|nr:nucleoside kinase [Bacilli bacterium]
MNNLIDITVNGKTKQFTSGITGLELSKYYKEEVKREVLACKVNNQIFTLNHKINKNCTVEFIDYMNRDGNKIYVKGLKFVLIIAIKEILGYKSDIAFEHSIDKGLFCRIINGKIDNEIFQKIKNKMKEIIELDLQFENISVTKNDLVNYYKKTNQIDKLNNLKTIASDLVDLNKCKSYYAYFYGILPCSTGALNKFDLTYLDNESLVLRFPVVRGDGEVPEYKHHEKVINVFQEYGNWIDIMKVSNVGSLNEVVSNGKINEFIRMNEFIQTKSLINIVDDITTNKKEAKIILIAGPSSSGKTTTAHKLCMYLEAKGLIPHMLSTDDYFVDRNETPLDENGEPDYESIDTIDLSLFNTQLNDLISGKEVSIPTFNFIKGEKEYNNRILKLEENDILVIEGLHTLNEKLTSQIPREKKVKVYISPFTPLSIDNYNHISTSDIRLLRRIVRDNRTRGHNVEATLKMWHKVRKGEEIYVFPYQDEADYIFNTAFIYETGVLKTYVEPLLFGIDIDSPYYEEAKRLIKFLRIFFPIPADGIPKDSLLREFIGNSCFYE